MRGEIIQHQCNFLDSYNILAKVSERHVFMLKKSNCPFLCFKSLTFEISNQNNHQFLNFNRNVEIRSKSKKLIANFSKLQTIQSLADSSDIDVLVW